MKVMFSWYIEGALFAIVELFLGFLCIHLSFAAGFGVSIIGLNQSTMVAGALITSILMFFYTPFMYYLHTRDDVKYVNKVEVPINKIKINDYGNLAVATIGTYSWVLKKNRFGHDLKKETHISFYNYYNRKKVFKYARTNTVTIR